METPALPGIASHPVVRVIAAVSVRRSDSADHVETLTDATKITKTITLLPRVATVEFDGVHPPSIHLLNGWNHN
jgi:hypothetical protein